MKALVKTILIILLMFVQLTSKAQNGEGISEQKKFSFKIGFGYYRPVISEDNVFFSNAIYDPDIGFGFSYLSALDYSISQDLSIGIGFNGNFSQAEFIREAVVDGQRINGYLDEGAVENIHILLNLTYAPPGDGIKPYAKLGIGYVSQEVELGDVPLELTNNVETEIFTDYKSNGVGVLPEIGIRYHNFYASALYSFSLDKLSGEEADGFQSSGEVSSHGIQVNLTYGLFRF